MEATPDIRLLLAVLAPLTGAGLVMAAGKRPNLREACSFMAACVMFGVTVSLIPDIRAGKQLVFTLFQLLPGLSITLRADALSMIFAVSASFLWIITVFYSAGYMRGLHEHAQTRFSVCFALALFGAIGCAFSDNLLTLYLFYEIVSITTYPLVAHHQDEEGYESGKKISCLSYLHRKGADPAGDGAHLRADRQPRLCAQRPQWHPAADREPWHRYGALYLLHPWLRQERHHAVAQLAAERNGRADAGERAAARASRS